MHSLAPLKRIGIPEAKILVDVRGITIEETTQFNSVNFVFRKIKSINTRSAFFSLKRFNHISVVSEDLRKYLLKKIPSASNAKIYVTPCLSGFSFKYDQMKRKGIREKLNIGEEDLVFVFSSGGTALWQANDAIRQFAEKGHKVINLSKLQVIHSKIMNCFVPYKEVPAYLSAADIAMIIRKPSIVNKVASPVKFSEYVCCGLPVISNGNVEMINGYIESTGHGMILPDINNLKHKDIDKLRSISRPDISRTGQARFSVDKISKDYLSIYRGMLKGR
jgi:hypothetical protein